MAAASNRGKVLVLLLGALVGAGLGVDGWHAPRLSATLSGVTSAASAGAPGGERRASPPRPDAAAARTGGPGAVAGRTGNDEGYSSPGSGARTAPPGDQGARAAAGAPGGNASRSVQAQNAPPAGGAGPVRPAPGPLLSQTWYGAYAYQVYPGTGSAETARVLTGFRLSFRTVASGTEEVAVTDLQDQTTQTATFDRRDRLYFIETRLGDDGFDGETNFGDDGFIVTDAQGHILGR